jgi:PRC-barrel domain
MSHLLRITLVAGGSLLLATLVQGQATTQSSTIPPAKAITLSDQEAQYWISRPIYSGDGKRFGDVAALRRDKTGSVIDLVASFGGFLGVGKSRVRLTPNDFTLTDGNVILYITAAEAHALPVEP